MLLMVLCWIILYCAPDLYFFWFLKRSLYIYLWNILLKMSIKCKQASTYAIRMVSHINFSLLNLRKSRPLLAIFMFWDHKSVSGLCWRSKSILNKSSLSFFFLGWFLDMKVCYLIMVVFMLNLLLIWSCLSWGPATVYFSLFTDQISQSFSWEDKHFFSFIIDKVLAVNNKEIFHWCFFRCISFFMWYKKCLSIFPIVLSNLLTFKRFVALPADWLTVLLPYKKPNYAHTILRQIRILLSLFQIETPK